MFKYILLFIIILESIFIVTLFKEPEFKVITVENTKIQDSLNNVINILKIKQDSIELKTDSVKKEIPKITKKYEEIFNTVNNQSVNSDIKFFTKYIEKCFSKNN